MPPPAQWFNRRVGCLVTPACGSNGARMHSGHTSNRPLQTWPSLDRHRAFLRIISYDGESESGARTWGEPRGRRRAATLDCGGNPVPQVSIIAAKKKEIGGEGLSAAKLTSIALKVDTRTTSLGNLAPPCSDICAHVAVRTAVPDPASAVLTSSPFRVNGSSPQAGSGHWFPTYSALCCHIASSRRCETSEPTSQISRCVRHGTRALCTLVAHAMI